MATKKQTPAKGEKIAALRVETARGVDSFRRAGYAFGPQPTDIPLADLDEKQIKAIKAEKMLKSEEITVDATGAGAEDEGGE